MDEAGLTREALEAEVDRLQARLATAGVDHPHEQYRSVVDNLIDGINTIDAAGLIHSINPAAGRIFGYVECRPHGDG